jgi:hypothetical protein
MKVSKRPEVLQRTMQCANMLELLLVQMLLFQHAVADHPPIQHIARGLRVTAPNVPKYSETISLDPIFVDISKVKYH